MKWRLWNLVALTFLATSCDGSDGVEVIERQVDAPGIGDAPRYSVCRQIEAFWPGSFDGEELGASDALPHLAALQSATESREAARSMDAAADALDAAG